MKKIIFKDKTTKRKIKQASQILQEGKILIHPTENLYGIGAIISATDTIIRISKIKKRNKKEGFIVLIGNISQLYLLVDSSAIGYIEEKLINQYWPGPLTIIFNAKKKYCQNPICYNKTIAVRLVGNEITREIINKVGIPIISTSINISGEKEALKTEDIIKKFESQIDGIVIDKIHTFTNKPSTIVKVVNKKIEVLREGAVTF